MACGCNKNKVTAAGVAQISGTHRVVVNDRQVYESSSGAAAETVGLRFDGASIKRPDTYDVEGNLIATGATEFWDAKMNAWLPR